MFDVSPVSFMIDVLGEVTGHRYEGTFKVKPILSHAEQLSRDIAMRDLLGPKPGDASGRATSQAVILAEIRIRSVEAPSWWKDSRDGLNLFDEVVLATLFDKIQEIEAKWKEDVKKKAEDVKVKLAELSSK